MLAAFKESPVEGTRYEFEFAGERGVDGDGIFRDALSAFWQAVFDKYFDGEGNVVPIIHPHLSGADYKTMGKIMYVGYLQQQYFPIMFSLPYILAGLFGADCVTDTILLEGFVGVLGKVEGSVLTNVLEMGEFDEDSSETLLEIFGRFGVTRRVTRETVREIALQCARVMLLQRPLFAYQSMELSILTAFPEFSSIDQVKCLYKAMRPTGRKVAALIQVEPTSNSQRNVVEYLQRAIRSFDEDLLMRFLRFATGSDSLGVPTIAVQFTSLAGLQRRIVAHTCTATLDVPVTYASYREFRSELICQLNSDYWDIDYV